MNTPSKRKTAGAWLDDRTGLLTAMRTCSEGSVRGGVGWRHVWPAAILFGFAVQAITGFFLWMFYSPSTQTAWESVYYLQYEVAGGWLLRGIHHYNAQVLVALTGLYFLWIVCTGAYRRPREFVFWTAVLMGLCALGGCLTGDLLPWDQNSYHATKTRVDFLNLLPLVGGTLHKLAAGGPEFGHHSLSRFFALHVGMVGGGFVLLLILYHWFAHRAEATQRPDVPAGPYWPDQMLRNMAAAAALMAVVLLLVFQHAFAGDHAGEAPGAYLGAGLGAPGDLDPANAYNAARPEWSFRGLYGFSNLFPGEMKIVPIFIVPGIVMAFVFAMPFIALRKWGHPVNVIVVGILLLGLVVLSYASWKHDWDDPGYLEDVAQGELEAGRARLLIEIGGVPPNGAATLLTTDRLFRRQCAACHDHAAEGHDMSVRAEETTAPNLYRFASREQVAGFLDPKRVTTADYFGNTAFRTGDMADFVKESLADLDEEELEEVEWIVMALSAEARLPSQREADKNDAKQIKEGRELIDGYGCTGCHKFHDKGSLGMGPDLTGYGSEEWLAGVISDPNRTRFYGKRNDRMPAYHESMTPQQILWMAEWLRRAWPLPADEPAAGQ